MTESYERVYVGESSHFAGVLEYSADTPIPFADIAEVYLAGLDAATSGVVNSLAGTANIRDDLATYGLAIGATNGALTWDIAPANTALVTTGAGAEEHQFELRIVTNSSPAKALEFRHRIHCTEFVGLTSMSEIALQLHGLKDSEGIVEDERRFLIELMIDAVTARMERECDRIFLKRLAASPHVKVFSPYETKYVPLSAWPVDSIVSVKEASDGDFDEATALEATDYHATPEGFLRHRSRRWTDGIGSLEVKWAGGLARHVGGVPADLRYGATRQVATWWQRRNDLGVSGKSVQGANVTLFFQGGLVPELKDLIPYYRRKVPVL